MKLKRSNRDISISLSDDESLVLYEWLHNFNEREDIKLFEDQAEQRILFDLESELETVIISTFKGNYQEILLKARDFIRDKEEI